MPSVLWILMLTIVNFKGSIALKMVLQPFDQKALSTKCRRGLIEGERLLTTATFISGDPTKRTPYALALLDNPWKHQTKEICRIDLNPEACNLQMRKTMCYCTKYKDPVYSVILNITAKLEYNNMLLSLDWPLLRPNPLIIYFGLSRTIPTIYGKFKPKLMLDGEPVILTPKCKLHLTPNKKSTFTFCTQFEMPDMIIRFNFGEKFFSQMPHEKSCASYDFTFTEEFRHYVYKFGYKDTWCDKEGVIRCYFDVEKCEFPDNLRGEWVAPGNHLWTFSNKQMFSLNLHTNPKPPVVTSGTWNCEAKVGKGYFLRNILAKQITKAVYMCLYLEEAKPSKYIFWTGPREKYGIPINYYVHLTKNGPLDPLSICDVEFDIPPDRIGIFIRNGLYYAMTMTEKCPNELSNGTYTLADINSETTCTGLVRNCGTGLLNLKPLPCLASGLKTIWTKQYCMHTEINLDTTYLILLKLDYFLKHKAPVYECLVLVKATEFGTIWANTQEHSCNEIKIPTARAHDFKIVQSSPKCLFSNVHGALSSESNRNFHAQGSYHLLSFLFFTAIFTARDGGFRSRLQ